MYSISTDPARNLVITTYSGFIQIEEIAAQARDEQQAVRGMGRRSFEYYALIDATQCSVLSQEVVAAIQEAISQALIKPRRLAVARTSALGQVQARRIASGQSDIGIFSDLKDAEAWLFEQ
jgi:hypothetical protein